MTLQRFSLKISGIGSGTSSAIMLKALRNVFCDNLELPQRGTSFMLPVICRSCSPPDLPWLAALTCETFERVWYGWSDIANNKTHELEQLSNVITNGY